MPNGMRGLMVLILLKMTGPYGRTVDPKSHMDVDNMSISVIRSLMTNDLAG